MHIVVEQKQLYMRIPNFLIKQQRRDAMRIKLILLVLLITTIVVLGACGTDSNQSQQDNTQTPEQAPTSGTPTKTPEATPTPTPEPTPVPDFAGVDFTGKWHVTQIIDSNGETVTESEMQSLDPGYILELLKDGVYFVYDKNDEILGQGDYAIELNLLTLTAAEQQTVYEVRDKDTLWCESSDKSVTVMTRMTNEPEPNNADAEDNTDGENNTDSEDGDDSDDSSQA